MNSRRLGLVIATLVLGVVWSKAAHAAVTPNPATDAIGDVVVKSSASGAVDLNNSGPGSVTVGSIVKNASCTTADITLGGLFASDGTTTVTFPHAISNGSKMVVKPSFSPQTRGTQSCQFDVYDDSTTPVLLTSYIVTGNGVAPVSQLTLPNGPPVDFGSVRAAVTGATASRTITITNSGDAGQDLILGTLTLTGAQSADYAITTDPSGTTVTHGNSTDVVVTFDPSATGTRVATLNIPSNDPLSSPQTVSLTGTGTSAIISLPASYDFGNVTAGGTGATHNIAVSNTGSGGTLSVTSAAIAGGAGWITFTNSPPGSPTCAGQTSCTFSPTLSIGTTSTNVQVQCKPPTDTTGTQSATLSFVSDADSGTASMTVMCSAVKPDITIDPNPHTHDFGDVKVNTTSTWSSTGIVITSAGGANLTFAIAKSGTNASEFVLSGPGCPAACGTTLVPGSKATYSVAFTPTGENTRSATLTITSNDQDSGESSQTFTLTGNGVEAVASPNPVNNGTLAFGSILVGAESTAQSVTLGNTGNQDLNISSATLTGTDFVLKTGSTGAQTVTPNGTPVAWTITCKPGSRGSKTGTFTVANDSTNLPTYTVHLTCTGTGGHLVASPTSLAFGNVREGNTLQKTFTLSNDGEVTVNISTSVINPNNVGYSVSGVPASLASGANATVTVTFAPQAGMDGGAATLTISSDWNAATVALSGTGQPFGIAISCPDCAGVPLTMDYGDVRWDDTKPEVFTVTNTATSPVSIQAVSLTATGNFTVVSPPSTPFTLGASQTTTITVDADPNDTMLGAFTSKLELLTDLPAPMNVIDVNLAVNSVSPALQINPGMMVDFGGVDIDQGVAKTVTITLQNTGDGTMDVIGAPAVSGVFTSAALGAGSVPVGGSTSIDVSYLPTVEKTAATADTNTLVVTLDGLFSSGDPQPSAIQISLSGYGIDRHLALMDSPIAFPATYRNVSDADAPVQAVTVENTGQAPLEVSAVMLTGDPVFTLLDTTPVTIDGGSQAQFHVRFVPTSDSASFTGTLALMHDDEDYATPRMAQVPITGTGAARPVTLSQNTLDLGVTGVGVPIRLSDKQPGGLQLINMSSTDSFTVRDLQLTGDTDQFQLINDASMTLAPGDRAQYDVEFAPDHAGDFSVTLQVYLDDDPDVQTSITITGKAVDVEVRGGGCDAGGGGGGWGLLVVLALAGLLVRRRARAAAAGAAALALVLAARPAAAGGPTRDVDLSTFSPAPATEPQGLELEGAEVGVPGAWALGLALNYASNPLHVESPQVTGMTDQPITSRTAAELDFAYAFLGRFEAGVRLPLLEQSGQMPQFSGLTPADGLALGDAALHGKAALASAGALSLGGSATLTLPTATSGQFAGASGVTAHVNGIAGLAAGRIGATLNVGFRVQGSARLGDIEQGNALTYGAGGSYRVQRALSVVGELFGQYGVGSPSTAGVSPLEVALGARYRMGEGLGVAAGVGRGLMPGIGAPDVRAFLLLSYAPRSREPQPLMVTHTEPVKPRDTGDDDGDGIINSDDKCPTDAEDKDGFQDEDGCPDNDNDGDGIPDSVDKCPNVAEDKDGFQDEDGCPDPDNDKDGIPDAVDKCPNEPEDKDGFQDNDGCDDPDNDHDGIPDVVDQCATEPETINGFQDDDGCPDKGESLVMVMADRIELFEPIQFHGLTATIEKKSNNVLGQVAATLRANREFKRIRVTVHVQARNGRDQELSDRRAEAVKAWLVKWGVEPERIEARGFGSSRLLVPRTQKGAAKINDRVEFIIMEKR